MLWLQSWFWMLFVGLFVFLLLLFPNGRLPSRRWRPFVGECGHNLSGSNLVVGYLSRCQTRRAPSPIQWLVLLLGLVAAASLVVGRRGARSRAPADQMAALRWSNILCGPHLPDHRLLHFAGRGSWSLWTGYLLAVVGGLGGPIAIGVAILRYRLYDIDLLINRTLVYGALTTTLVGVYVSSVVVLQGSRALTGQESQLAIVASTLVVAALFNWLRRRIQFFIDRRFYRNKYDAGKTLEAFSARLRNETDLDALSDDLVGVVGETMQPAHISLWLRPDTASKGKQPGMS